MKTLPAFQRGTVFNAALEYRNLGFSVIPCNVDKRPAILWQKYQERPAPLERIIEWFSEGNHFRTKQPGKGYQSIGVVLGRVSNNLVAVDLDGWDAVRQFYQDMPQYQQRTLTIKTGSQNGVHLYFFVDFLPENVNVRTDAGGFELRGNGQYVIAPPSIHPSGNRYEVLAAREIANVVNLDDISEYFASLRRAVRSAPLPAGRPVKVKSDPRKDAYLSRVVSDEYSRVECAPLGGRNNALFYASLRLANFAAAGELVWSTCEQGLLSAARSAGLPEMESRRTIESAWNIGKKQPKRVKV